MIITIIRSESKNFSLGDLAIKAVEGTNFSHYGILWDNVVIHSTMKGVLLETLDDFIKSRNIVSTSLINLPHLTVSDVYTFYNKYKYEKYGYIQDFYILLRRLRLVKKYPRFAVDNIICSELVMRFFYEFCNNVDDVEVGLREVEKYLRENYAV